MWPVYRALSQYKDNLDVFLCHSNQHDGMAVQTFEVFNISPNYTFHIHQENKLKLGYLSSELLKEFTNAFEILKPSLVLVHGDTLTALSGAIAAFLLQVSIGHVEAGLRTSRYENPFPEEASRRMISRISALHFAPTPKSAMNLRSEGINKGIYVTGNTVVDSLQYVLTFPDSVKIKEIRTKLLGDNKFIIVTCHRRESYGEPLELLCKALYDLVCQNEKVILYFPVHTNPRVANIVKAFLTRHDRIITNGPSDYNDFVQLLSLANLVITDSGGVLEESVVLGKPCIVLREETERPEASELASVRLVGYNMGDMSSLAKAWLESPPEAEYSTIFGDGSSGEEIAEIIDKWFKNK